jgi:hypothetical protein
MNIIYPIPKNRLELTDDEFWTISSSLLQSFSIMTDIDGYYDPFKLKSVDFRIKNREKVSNLEKSGWERPEKETRL